MPRRRSERIIKTHQGKWEEQVEAIHNQPEREPDTYENIAEFYTAYLCGVLDVLAEFKGSLYAADVKETLKGTVESIIKDAWALQRQGR